MTFTYDIENTEGEIVATVSVDAIFSPYVPEIRRGHPDNWCPAEGGDLEELTVWFDGKNVTDTIDSDVLDKIAKEANYRWDPQEEERLYDDR